MKKNNARFLTVTSACLAALMFTASANAETTAFRNSSSIDLMGNNTRSTLVVQTHPAQPHQPVYIWRNHTVNNGGKGALGNNGERLGYTNAEGVLFLSVDLPNDPIYCGVYTNERFAVGSPSAPKSAPLSFQIYRGMDFGPRHPNCLR